MKCPCWGFCWFKSFQIEGLENWCRLPRKTRGLWERLTPEQKEAALTYRGPEVSGDQSLPKRNR
jgi:hypothetical protein